jgi:pimeloyl-ACP methyl ester carboxylesterase
MARADQRPILPTIRVPTLVVVGENDVMTPVAMSQEIADAIPGTEFRIVPDCGHMPPIEKPAERAALVEGWLTRAP